jgi:hypothetical protein
MHGTCAIKNPSRAEHPKKVRYAGSHSRPSSRARCDSRTRRFLRSANGQMPIPILRAAHELRRISADSNSDSSLLLKTKTTNRED